MSGDNDSESLYQSLLNSVASFFVPTLSHRFDDELMESMDDHYHHHHHREDEDVVDDGGGGDDRHGGEGKGEQKNDQQYQRQRQHVSTPISIVSPSSSSSSSSLRRDLEKQEVKSLPSFSLETRFSTTATIDHEEDQKQREQDLKEEWERNVSKSMPSSLLENHLHDSMEEEEEEEEEGDSDDHNDHVYGIKEVNNHEEHKSEHYDSESIWGEGNLKQRQRSVSAAFPSIMSDEQKESKEEVGQRGSCSISSSSSSGSSGGPSLLEFWKTSDFSFKSKNVDKTPPPPPPLIQEERDRSNSTGTLKDMWNRWFSSSPENKSDLSESPPQREKDEIQDFVQQIRSLNAKTEAENNNRKQMARGLNDTDANDPKSEYGMTEALTREIENQVVRLEQVTKSPLPMSHHRQESNEKDEGKEQ